jgi:hypothetical protein
VEIKNKMIVTDHSLNIRREGEILKASLYFTKHHIFRRCGRVGVRLLAFMALAVDGGSGPISRFIPCH